MLSSKVPRESIAVRQKYAQLAFDSEGSVPVSDGDKVCFDGITMYRTLVGIKNGGETIRGGAAFEYRDGRVRKV